MSGRVVTWPTPCTSNERMFDCRCGGSRVASGLLRRRPCQRSVGDGGRVVRPWTPGDDAGEALRGYLETSHLPDGRYRVSVSSAPEDAGTEIEFRRMTPMPPVRQLRHGWNTDYTT